MHDAELKRMRELIRTRQYLLMERGLILAAIVVVAVAPWVTLGQRLAEKPTTVVGSF